MPLLFSGELKREMNPRKRVGVDAAFRSMRIGRRSGRNPLRGHVEVGHRSVRPGANDEHSMVVVDETSGHSRVAV